MRQQETDVLQRMPNMIRIGLQVIVCSIFAVSSWAQQTTQAPDQLDLVADGVVDQRDVMVFLKLARRGDLGADLNADGKIEPGDLALMVQWLGQRAGSKRAVESWRVWDFNGTLPAYATFSRSTPRQNAKGQLANKNVPRWRTTVVGLPAKRLVQTPLMILGTGEVDGQTWTVFRNTSEMFPRLTNGTPGLDANLVDYLPAFMVRSSFGFGVPWGMPTAATILGDGTVLLHNQWAGLDSQQTVIATTVSTYSDIGGMRLAYTSPYVPHPGQEAFTPKHFTAGTYLPNLGVWAASMVEYNALGMGAAIGSVATSADGFLQWTQVLNLWNYMAPVVFPNGLSIDRFKHIHQIRPFEYFRNGKWRIGALGLLGDMDRQIMVRIESSGATFSGPGVTLSVNAMKGQSRHQLTDAFPISPSQGAVEPAKFLLGNDASQAGMFKAEVFDDVMVDRSVFRPSISFWHTTLNMLPFTYKVLKLGNGSFVAATVSDGSARAGGTISVSPEGMWISDAAGELWTEVHHSPGDFKAIGSVGENRAWIRQTAIGKDELWEFSPPIVRNAIELGPAVDDIYNITRGYETSVASIRTDIPAPIDAPQGTRVWQIFSESAKGFSPIHDVSSLGDLQPGNTVSVVFWVRPIPADVNIVDMNVLVKQVLTDGSVITSESKQVALDANDWTRISVPTTIDPQGATKLRLRLTTTQTATAKQPLAYYATDPQVLVGNQLCIQPTLRSVVGGPSPRYTAEDRLTCELPAMGDQWTMLIWGTAAPDFTFSLVDAGGLAFTVEPDADPLTGFLNLGLHTVLKMQTPTGVSRTTVPRDVFFPTQTFLAIVHQANGITHAYVGRGMGSDAPLGGNVRPEHRVFPVAALTPTQLRFGTPDWSRVFQGMVHRVIAMPNRALTAQEIEIEMARFPKNYPSFSSTSTQPAGSKVAQPR